MAEDSSDDLSVPDVWNTGRNLNPYLHNLFVLLECDPDESERNFDKQRQFVATQVKRGGKEVNGHALRDVDITAADEMAAQAPKFVASRLLVHSSHRVEKAPFADAIKAVESFRTETVEDLLPLAVRDLTELRALMPEPDEVLPNEESVLSRDELPELFLSSAEDEQILDL